MITIISFISCLLLLYHEPVFCLVPSSAPSSLPTVKVIDVVLSYADLLYAVSHSENGDTIIIGADISILATISLDRSLIFQSDPTSSSNYILDGSQENRLFELLDNGPQLSLLNLTLVNGRHISKGGAIYCHSECLLDLTGSYLMHNTAVNSDGGAIYAEEKLTILGGTITQNYADRNGGGVACCGSTSNNGLQGTMRLMISDTTIAFNSAVIGGGIYIGGGDLSLSSVLIASNEARATSLGSGGGGIYMSYGSIYGSNSEISNNRARYSGGGIMIKSHMLQLTDTTLSNNTALYGAAICADDCPQIHLIRTQIVGNSATRTYGNGGGLKVTHRGTTYVHLEHSLISDNTAYYAGEGITCDVKCIIDSKGHTIRDSVSLGSKGPNSFSSQCHAMKGISNLNPNKKIEFKYEKAPRKGVPQFYSGHSCEACYGGDLINARQFSKRGQWYCSSYFRGPYPAIGFVWLITIVLTSMWVYSKFKVEHSELTSTSSLGSPTAATVSVSHINNDSNSRHKKLLVSVVFAQLSGIGNVIYLVIGDFHHKLFYWLGFSFLFLPTLVFSALQYAHTTRQLKLVHMKAIETCSYIWELLSKLFHKVNLVRTESFSFERYDDFYQVVMFTGGVLLFIPISLVCLLLSSPLWIIGITVYASHIVLYMIGLFIFTSCKCFGVHKLAEAYYHFGQVSSSSFDAPIRGVQDETNITGGRRSSHEAHLTVSSSPSISSSFIDDHLYTMVLIQLLFESLPIFIVASINESLFSNSGDDPPVATYVIQVITTSLFLLNEVFGFIKFCLQTSHDMKMEYIFNCWRKFCFIDFCCKSNQKNTSDLELAERDNNNDGEGEGFRNRSNNGGSSKNQDGDLMRLIETKFDNLEKENLIMKEQFEKVMEENKKYKKKIKKVEEKMSLLRGAEEEEEEGYDDSNDEENITQTKETVFPVEKEKEISTEKQKEEIQDVSKKSPIEVVARESLKKQQHSVDGQDRVIDVIKEGGNSVAEDKEDGGEEDDNHCY